MLLHDQKFMGQMLPRIPVLVMRELESKLERYADAGRAKSGQRDPFRYVLKCSTLSIRIFMLDVLTHLNRCRPIRSTERTNQIVIEALVEAGIATGMITIGTPGTTAIGQDQETAAGIEVAVDVAMMMMIMITIGHRIVAAEVVIVAAGVVIVATITADVAVVAARVDADL
jgi:hypothetical protein